MTNRQSNDKDLVLAFGVGAALGAAVGYSLARRASEARLPDANLVDPLIYDVDRQDIACTFKLNPGHNYRFTSTFFGPNTYGQEVRYYSATTSGFLFIHKNRDGGGGTQGEVSDDFKPSRITVCSAGPFWYPELGHAVSADMIDVALLNNGLRLEMIAGWGGETHFKMIVQWYPR